MSIIQNYTKKIIYYFHKPKQCFATLLCETHDYLKIKTSKNILINLLCQKNNNKKKKHQSIKVREK